MSNNLVLIKGAGDLASGVAHRLSRCGFTPVMTELPRPLVVRRTVSFAEAVYVGEITVEGVRAVLADDVQQAKELVSQGVIPVIIDEKGETVQQLKPQVVIDAIMAKKNTGTKKDDAEIVIALGPGFTAGVDVHAVVETKRGHYLGRVIWQGAAIPNTGKPGPVMGISTKRLLRAGKDGIFTACKEIGERVASGDTVGWIDNTAVRAEIDGVLRGLIHSGVSVTAGLKIGDIDPRAEYDYCFTISDKARAVAGGVLEAMLTLMK